MNPSYRPIHASRRILAGVALGGILASVGIAGANQPTSERIHIGQRDGTTARVYGCHTEDSCTMDYRGDRNGRGVWIVKQVTP